MDLTPYLEQLKRREITNREVARILGVSEAHLSRVLKTLIVKDPPQNYRKKRTEFLQVRKEFRDHVANTLPVKEAAKRANCSERTIRRHIRRD